MGGELRATLQSAPVDEVFHVSMRMSPEPAVLADGDVYRVRVVDGQNGAVLMESERRVTYDAVFPNSVECDTHPCRNADITFG